VERVDVVVVGGGPAGAAAALAAVRADPSASVLVLDRADFPRDKVCGDGIAPEALDALAALGVDPAALTEGFAPVPRLRLTGPSGAVVEREMRRPAAVVPRLAFDNRLLEAAGAAGAHVRRMLVRQVERRPDGIEVNGSVTASVLVAADGAESVVRRAVGVPAARPDQVAVAIRGYAPEPPGTAGVQVVTTTARRWPAYAWSFPLGDGRTPRRSPRWVRVPAPRASRPPRRAEPDRARPRAAIWRAPSPPRGSAAGPRRCPGPRALRSARCNGRASPRPA